MRRVTRALAIVPMLTMTLSGLPLHAFAETQENAAVVATPSDGDAVVTESASADISSTVETGETISTGSTPAEVSEGSSGTTSAEPSTDVSADGVVEGSTAAIGENLAGTESEINSEPPVEKPVEMSVPVGTTSETVENGIMLTDLSGDEPDGTSFYDGYAPGVTVIEDEDSPTGYTAVFVYEEQDIDYYKEHVNYAGATNITGDEITRVQLYSDCMMLFDPDDDSIEAGKTPSGSQGYTPDQYRIGLMPAGGSQAVNGYTVDLEEFAEGKWGVTIPLSSGAFVYNYQVTDENGTVESRLDDPNNTTMLNEATGIHSLSSMVYVPYNSDKQGTGDWADRSVENARTDSKTGKIETISYTGAADDKRGLAVYLPYGYDADRSEPYKVLYLSHGASGDKVGNELRWMNEGGVANIMDNLIAADKTEPYVVVTMNNQDLGWSYDKIWAEQELIMAEIESRYNVYDVPDGRAFAGLSMGGITTSNMLLNHADAFSYYGVWSAANADLTDKGDYLQEQKDHLHLFLAAGQWDFGLGSVNNLGSGLKDLGIDYDYLTVPGAHDWETWQLIYAYAAENFFWKDDTKPVETFDYSSYKPGVTVIEDEDSPTGYTAVFVFDENSEDPADYGLEDIANVQVYSDGMFLFSYDEQAAGTALDPGTVGADGQLAEAKNAHNPDEFEVGMYPAGGDTTGSLYGGKKIAYYQDMTEFASGMWGTTIPLTSGATYYNYRLTDSNGKRDSSYIDDPANPAMVNTASGVSSRSSMVYVPYSDKMGTGEWADRTVENPRTDGQTGTVEFATYTGAKGEDRYLGIYLPNGYDANRTEPYNVLYLSHGAQSESVGCELRWLNECAAVNILDNLEVDYIVVTMNNTDMDGWKIDNIWADQQLIMSYIEENYNVGKEPANRAYAGLSMGGITASRMYAYHADQFGYIGIWSAAMPGELTGDGALTADELSAIDCKLSLSAGDWDYLLNLVDSYAARLHEIGIDYDYFTVPGSHDWRTWQAILTKTAKDFFFNAAEPVDTFDYSSYKPGVTVIEDANSPTGYTAVFVYEEQDIDYYKNHVNYAGAKNITGDDITRVQLYSDCMMLFDPADTSLKKGSTPTGAQGYTPDAYKAGLMPAGGSQSSNGYTVDLYEFADGMWGVTVPLSSGAFVYNYQVTDENGNVESRLDDPNNETLTNSATGVHSLSSMVYVPYNSDKQGTGDWSDRSVENPRTDGKTGTIETISYYSDVLKENRALAVYLPYGYDANREEPYKVLYISHGTSGDGKGNELRWLNEGAVANINDNLIAEGKVEPFVVVAMNNQDAAHYAWMGNDWSALVDEQVKGIMPYIEAHYNVSTKASGRAYAGLSRGGMLTSLMYYQHADLFDYYGVWSYAFSNVSDYAEYLTGLDHQPELLLTTGIWDFGYAPIQQMASGLKDLGIDYEYLEVPAAHDWENWQLVYAYAAENFLWKNGADQPVNPDDGKGDVVDKDHDGDSSKHHHHSSDSSSSSATAGAVSATATTNVTVATTTPAAAGDAANVQAAANDTTVTSSTNTDTSVGAATGDSSHMMVYGAVAAMAVVMLAVWVVMNRKRENP